MRRISYKTSPAHLGSYWLKLCRSHAPLIREQGFSLTTSISPSLSRTLSPTRRGYDAGLTPASDLEKDNVLTSLRFVFIVLASTLP